MPLQTPIRILECIRQGQIGGGESHLLSLVENMDRTSFEPVVLSFTEGPMIASLQNMGIQTKVISTTRPFDFTKWKLVKKFLQDEKIKLVHAHGTRATSNVLWAARSLKIPVIYTVHGWSFHDDQNRLVKKIRIWGEKYLTSHTQLNISVSASNQQTGKKEFSSFNSVVVNNGINHKKFNPDKTFSDIRTELSIAKDAELLLFLARFTNQKQPLALIRAFAKAVQQNNKLHLLMIGNGDQRQEAETIIANAGLQPKITLLDFRQDVPDLLAAADIFVLPSLWEGLPIALLEAMAMGKAIITTRADGTSEIIQHEENGILADLDMLEENLAAAILRLAADKELKKKIQLNARLAVKEKFNAEKMTRETEILYKKILAN